ncbi:MAG: hypothetical protein ACD_22C00266G0004 [uncultured bacterium]|nr:MAG: hypothetical protein ACD_22C00266G0004 [uncultured bacterium]
MNTENSYVIDTSVAVKWFNRQDESYIEQADKLLRDSQLDKVSLIMPELAKYEIGNALLNKRMPLANTLNSLATCYSIPIHFIPQDRKQAQSAMQIAFDEKLTFYDASFMALAKELDAHLITDNPKHQKRKVKGLKVINLEDY